MNIPVMVGGCVYHTGMCVMDIKIVMMDLMKQTVVRDLELNLHTIENYVTGFWKTYHLHTNEIIRIFEFAALWL